MAENAELSGVFRYQCWLPVVRRLDGSCLPLIFRSERLNQILGLENLWISFSGYWPERGVAFRTPSFKELEAYTALARLPGTASIPVVASTGNSAAAFATVFSEHQAPCMIIIPDRGLSRMWLRTALGPSVRLVVLDDADYSDAISVAKLVARQPGYQLEGGVFNVARRDGLGTVMFAAVETIGDMPDYYFQAVGSGAGAIAAHEASVRLGNGEGGKLPRLMVCQNKPFTPILNAWRRGLDYLPATSAERDKLAISKMHAHELANRYPPYSIQGGVYNVLMESSGEALASDNESTRSAMKLFQETEGVDIEPAAGVALACLRQAADRARISPDATILLNVTGGGRAKLARDYSLTAVQPRLRMTGAEAHTDKGGKQIAGIFP